MRYYRMPALAVFILEVARMLSFERFFARIAERARAKFRRIILGYHVKDKLLILVIEVLKSVPRNIRNRSSFLGGKIEEILVEMCIHTVVQVNGIKYTLIDSSSFAIVSDDFESFMPIWLKPRRGEVVVDIGAHIGKYSLILANVVGNNGKIIAVEPALMNYQTLLTNLILNNIKNVVALNLAAWHACMLKFFIADTVACHSAKINGGLGWISVKARALDGVLEKLGLGRVDWIKIDVEGAEFEVLSGLEKAIKTYRPRIIVEILYENVERVKKFVKKYGYSVIRISPFFDDARAHVARYTYFLCYPTLA